MTRTRRSRLVFLGFLMACKHVAPEATRVVEIKVADTGDFAAVVIASEQTHSFEVGRLTSDGHLKWNHPVNCSTINGIDVHGEAIVMRCAAPGADHIWALGTDDGKELWHYEEKVGDARTEGRVKLVGDAVVAYGDDRFIVLGALDGKLRLTYPSDLDQPVFANGHAYGLGVGTLVDIDLHTGAQAAVSVGNDGCIAGGLYLEHSGATLTQRPTAAIQTAAAPFIDALLTGADRVVACDTYQSDLVFEFETTAPRSVHMVRADKSGRVISDLKIDDVMTQVRGELSMPDVALPRWVLMVVRDEHGAYLSKIDLDDFSPVAKLPERLANTELFLSDGNWFLSRPNTVMKYAGATGKPGSVLEFVSLRPVRRMGANMIGGNRQWIVGDGWTNRDAVDLLVLDDQDHPLFSRGISLKSPGR